MEPFLVSTAVVALAEIGDKTQLLALVLAARFRRPLAIILGILVATLANHGLAALAGASLAWLLDGPWLDWGLGLSFLAMGLWTLVPDKIDDAEAAPRSAAGAFLATTVSFFLVEIGDKTQVATIALAAQYQAVVLVAAATTLGMMLANVPAVLIGEAAATRLPLKPIRLAAAGLFIALGAVILAQAVGWL